MKVPKLYSPVKIKFWGLRNGLGANLGVIFDIDTQVVRRCMRVACEDGWKWQIVSYYKLCEWDYFVEQDQEMLNEYGGDMEGIELNQTEE